MWFLVGFLTAGFLFETAALVWVLFFRGRDGVPDHTGEPEAKNTMDEGFENIMSFSVRGQDGFGGDG